MARHLARRGGIWWTRLVVPERLRQAVGRREFIQSCRTADLRIAKTVAAMLIAEWRQSLMRVELAGMDFIAADMPNANKVMIQMHAVMSEWERDQI